LFVSLLPSRTSGVGEDRAAKVQNEITVIGYIAVQNHKSPLAETTASELQSPQPLQSGWHLTTVNNIATFDENNLSFSIPFLKIRGLALWASRCILRPACKFAEVQEINPEGFRKLGKAGGYVVYGC
jgi:hypothetical protein